jgi:signal peptidase II
VILLLGLAAGVLAADQITKAWALRRLHPSEPWVLVEGFFDLTLVMNPGVAFGILAGVPPGWRWLVAVFSIAALALLASLALRMVPDGGRVGTVALGLVFGGAVGNLVDRWRFGAVVDFFHFFWRDWHWPNFNVADSAITVGVILLAAELWFAGPEPARGPDHA